MTDRRSGDEADRRFGGVEGRLPRRLAWLILLCTGVLVSCGSETPPNPVKDAFAQAGVLREDGATVAFRFAPDPGVGVQLYRLPNLARVDWDFEAAGAAMVRTVGFAGDEDLLYALTSAGELVALDLTTGRTRVIDTAVVHAALGPAGTPYLVRADGTVGRVTRRTVIEWSTRADPLPSAIWAGARNRIVALAPTEQGDRWLMSLADGRPTVMQRIPEGQISIAAWGDVAVVSTDSGLAVFDPADSAKTRFRKLRRAPGPVAVSPAAHQIYTVDVEGKLLVYDRFELRRLRSLQMPGTATDLRADPLGRLLLIRAADGERVWVVDTVRWELVATVEASWGSDLPTVTPDGTVLARQGDDVVAVGGESYAAIARADGGAGDLWLAVAWDPRRPTLQVMQDSVPEAAPGGGAFFVQVSSTRNKAWAEDFAQNLRRAGMAASVLTPRDLDDLYRVVLGPFPTREAAETVSRQLGLPSWITQRDTASGVP